ncbi:tyrosine-type recombinase/integrase [Niabella aquatica]
MASSIKLTLRKDKLNNQGLAPIHFRITKNRKSSYISSGQYIKESEWDIKNKRVKTNHKNSGRLNALLSAKMTELHAQLLEAETQQKIPTAKGLKHEIFGKPPVDFFEYATNINVKNYTAGKIGTYDKNKAIIKKLKEYNKNQTLALTDITPPFLEKYEVYLRGLGNKTNTIHKDMKYIRKIFNDAYREELIEHKDIPFRIYKLKTEKTTRSYLTDEEVLAIEKLKLNDGSKISLHRDMFVFACYAAGLRVSDVLMLRWKDYDGTYLHTTSRKTKTQLSIKLPAKAVEILSNYQHPNVTPNDYIFPVLDRNLDISNPVAVDGAISRATAYINKKLKSIAKKAEIEKPLSFHVSRHSFATRALTKGIAIDKVGRLLGHQNLAVTQIYAKIVSSELDKAMSVFD